AVEFSPEDAALSARGTREGVHLNAFHRRQIDHEAIVNRRPAGYIVSAAAYRYREAELMGQQHGIDDIGGAATAGDDRRALVDQSVVPPADVVVLGVGRPQQPAGERWSGERNGFSNR